MDKKTTDQALAACRAAAARVWRRGARLVLAPAPLALAACATVNTPLNDQHALKAVLSAGSEYTFARWLEQRPEPMPELVILSFSGGGARAAALAAGVLDELAKQDLDKKVALISSTSGGSLTAAVFAAQGRDGIDSLSQDFLARNHNFKLAKQLAPSLLLPGGENRGVSFGRYLDANVFVRPAGSHPLTYGDLTRRWGEAPFVLLNSTDMGSGRSFEFTQDNFYNLCSDLSKFPVSQAVAASAAFPFLLNPVPLQNHWGGRDCSGLVPGERGLALLNDAQDKGNEQPEQLSRARYEYALRNTGNPAAQPAPDREIAFLHLLDGGLTDNLGARAILRQLHANYATLKAKGVRKILLMQVNARSTMKSEYDKSAKMPSMMDVFLSVAERPIDIATELSSYLSRLYLLNLVTSDAAGTAPANRISIYPVDVDFELLDKEHNSDRLAAEAIDTDWGLPNGAATVRFLKDTASELMGKNPCFRSFVAVPPGPGIQDPRETCKFVQIVAQASSVASLSSSPPRVAMAPPPPPMAPPPPPMAPPSMKVTYPADIFFDFDKYVLKPEGKAKLDDLVSRIQGINLEVIIAVGHTDSVGTDSYNQRLSVRRAEAVKGYLVSKGIEKNRVYAEGKGEKQPIADNRTVETRAKNRRVEIEVVGTRNW